MSGSVLYDVPGPRARARNLALGVLAGAGVLGLLWYAYRSLTDASQFTAAMWDPFQYKNAQQMIVDGLLATLKAFATAAVLSLILGTLLAAGGSPTTSRSGQCPRRSCSSSGRCRC
ncbi:hypothetical protein ACFQ0T_12600 [Kitasatospora gansuensis]